MSGPFGTVREDWSQSIQSGVSLMGFARRLDRSRTAAALLLALVAGAGTAVIANAGAASAAGPSITVTPSSGLSNGQTVTVTGSGFTAGQIGNILECNNDPHEPTVNLPAPVSSQVGVGCIPPSYAHIVTVDSSGNVNHTFNVIGGTVGPPCAQPQAVITTCPPTDSTGGNPATDAANFPCPPTAAQQAAGDVCQLTYGDQKGESATANILFGSETPPTSSTTTAPPAPTTTAATTAATTPTTAAPTVTTTPAATAGAGSPSLASTGPGPHLWLVAVAGTIALYLGSVALAVLARSRRRRADGSPLGADDLWFEGREP